MRSFAIHLIALLALLAIPALAADMPDAERTKIEQATAARIQADRDKVQIDAIANRAAQLLRDPATQILGDAQGDVTIVEFFDYQCPYCKAVQPRLEALIAGDKKVRWVVKEFPILSPESLVASKAALASVKQGKYAQFHTAMMDHKGRLEMSDIWAIAQSVGLDAERLKADMTAPEIMLIKEGALTHENRKFDALTAIGVETEEQPVPLTAIEPTEIIYIKLPTF